MEQADTLSKVTEAVADVLGVEKQTITPSSTFEQLGVDSLDMIQIIMKFEETFTIEKITDEQAAQIKTVQDAVNLIESLRSK